MSKEMTAVSVKEPLMHISKRDGIEPYKAWLIRLAAVLISLIVCAGVIFALTGLNPIEVYKGVFDGAVGTKRRVWIPADAGGKRPVCHGLGRNPGIFQGILEYQ